MPFLDRATDTIAENAWGNADDTADYLMRLVAEVCDKFGGDRENLVLTGFSRGAIACGYIGLRNDDIAKLWKGFHACQHTDGSNWNGATMASAIERAARFQGQANRGQTGIHAIFSKSVADPPKTGTGEVDNVIAVSEMDFHPVGTVLVDQCAVDTNGVVVGRVQDLLKPVDRIGAAKAIRNLGSLQSKQDTTRQIGRNSRR